MFWYLEIPEECILKRARGLLSANSTNWQWQFFLGKCFLYREVFYLWPVWCYIKFFWYIQVIVISNSTKIMTPTIPHVIAKELCNTLHISNFHAYASA